MKNACLFVSQEMVVSLECLAYSALAIVAVFFNVL
jgi:hypothetical protein